MAVGWDRSTATGKPASASTDRRTIETNPRFGIVSTY
jgi:hypothetical protein